MEQNKYIEVTIIEPIEIPTSDSSSNKGLSTIYEQNGLKITDPCMQKNPISSSLKPNVECSPFRQGDDSFRKFDQPLDIDMLLRYYACNSNMEKAINNVLKETNEKRLDYSNDPLIGDIDQGPLVELSVASKICDSLKESSSMSSVLSTFRFHEILTKLRCLIGRCNGKKLDEILQNNPSMKMCKHCGVISCSKFLNTALESKKSPPNFSYFFNADIFANDAQCSNEDIKLRKEVKKFSPNSAKKIEKPCNLQKNAANFVHKRHKKKNLAVNQETRVHKDPRRVETMIAERENDSRVIKKPSKKDETELQDCTYSQATKLSPFKMKGNVSEPQQTKISSLPNKDTNFQNKDTTKLGTGANFACGFSFDKRFDQLNCKQKLIDNTLSNKQNDLSVEQIVKDILYEKSKTQLDEGKAQTCTPVYSLRNVNNKQNQSNDLPIDNSPFANIMSYLALGRLEPVDKRKEEFVSQFDDGTRAHSRRFNNQHSFILHGGQIDIPRLELDASTCNELKPPVDRVKSEDESSKDSPIDSINLKFNEPFKAFKESSSFSCLVEDDSLENCIKQSQTLVESGDSGTTVGSTSSAENMIREWVNSSDNNDKIVFNKINKRLVVSKHSASDLEAKPQPVSSNRSAHLVSDRQCETYSLRRRWCTVQKNSFRQTMSYTLNSEFPSNQQSPNEEMRSFRKAESLGSKRFLGKKSLGFFKSIKSKKILRSKETSLNTQSSTFSSNCFRGDRIKNVTRRIIYNEPSLKTTIGRSGRYNGTGNILSLYRKILENTERMDWQSFQRFVEELHPNQKKFWRDICKVIDNEAQRLGEKGGTEVCIEINSVPSKSTKKGKTCRGKIMFEMDITLEEVERCLGRQLASTEKAQLDIHKRANEVIKARNDDVCDSEVVFNQAE